MIGTKFLARAVVAAAALAVAAPSAQAQTPVFTGSGCGGDTFNACATWNVSLLNSTTIQMTVTNNSGALAGNPNSMFTQILLGNLPNYTVTGFSATPGVGSWSLVSGCTGNGAQCGYNGFLASVVGTNDQAPVSQNGLGAGQTATFTFTLSGPIQAQASDFTNAQLAIHDQGANACGLSTRVVFDANGQPVSGYTNNCGMSTVPEPSSMALLGTGLFGLVPMIRRKVRK